MRIITQIFLQVSINIQAKKQVYYTSSSFYEVYSKYAAGTVRSVC